MALSIALGLYTVRDAYREDFSACLAKTAAIGYTAVECFGAPTLPAQEVAEALSQNHLTLAGWHMPIDQLEGDALAGTLVYLQTLGLKRIVIPYMPPETFKTRASTLAFAERINAIRARLSQSGIELGYHNHSAELTPTEDDGALPWALLMDNTSVFGQLDTGNALSSGTPGLRLPSLISQWPGRAMTIHAKPYSYAKGFESMIGEDDIDWDSFLRACNQDGATEWVIVEHESAPGDPFDAAAQCLHALKKYISQQ